jgi:hypothetical protein
LRSNYQSTFDPENDMSFFKQWVLTVGFVVAVLVASSWLFG